MRALFLFGVFSCAAGGPTGTLGDAGDASVQAVGEPTTENLDAALVFQVPSEARPGRDAEVVPSRTVPDGGFDAEAGACPFLRGDCDGQRSNGCEAFLASDTLHCGRCRRACGAEACTAGLCGPSALLFAPQLAPSRFVVGAGWVFVQDAGGSMLLRDRQSGVVHAADVSLSAGPVTDGSRTFGCTQEGRVVELFPPAMGETLLFDVEAPCDELWVSRSLFYVWSRSLGLVTRWDQGTTRVLFAPSSRGLVFSDHTLVGLSPRSVEVYEADFSTGRSFTISLSRPGFFAASDARAVWVDLATNMLRTMRVDGTDLRFVAPLPVDAHAIHLDDEDLYVATSVGLLRMRGISGAWETVVPHVSVRVLSVGGGYVDYWDDGSSGLFRLAK